MENLSRGQGFVVPFFPARNEHVSIAQQRGARPPSRDRHLPNYGEPAGRRIIQFSGICSAVANPSSRDQYFSRRQQHRDLPNPTLMHVSRWLELAGGRIVQFGGTIEILISTHPSRDENLGNKVAV